MESLQSSHDQVQSDLKLAFKRISDLQRALEDGAMDQDAANVERTAAAKMEAEEDAEVAAAETQARKSQKTSFDVEEVVKE